VSYLGFKLTSCLDPKPRIDMVCCKALGFIMSTAHFFGNRLFLKLFYCTLVQSILEYASVICDPNTISSFLKIEHVQRRFLWWFFTLIIPHTQHDYKPVATILRLNSLADCRHSLNLQFLKHPIWKSRLTYSPIFD